MKYLKSFNESVGVSADEMDNINDICLDLIDLGLQYRIIASTKDGEYFTNHIFVSWDQQTRKHSESGIYNNMMVEIYDKYDVSSGGGSESGDIKITEELINIITRINKYLDSDIKFGIYYLDDQEDFIAPSVDYIEIEMNDFERSLEKLDQIKISQIDIRTENKRPY